MENYSLSDIAAASGNEGFGGNMGFFWIFALLLLAGGGFGGLGGGAATTNEILSGQQFDRIGQQVQGIANGLSSLGYSQLQQMDANTASINGNVTSEGRAIQSQIADNYCSIKEAIHSEGEATRSLIQQNKIEALQNRLNTVEMQQAISAATAGVVKYPTATTYSSGCNPFCGCNCNAI